MRLYLGVDPGKSGAMALVDETGELHTEPMRLKETAHDVWYWLSHTIDPRQCFAMLENVHAMPGQGVSSTFKFGQSFGQCEAFLVAAGIPYELVTPQKWQKALGCRSKGDKNVTKAKAQQLFPGHRVIHATADAMLIAEYARRVREGIS